MNRNVDNSSQLPLLLHACCGPCSLEPVRLLQKRGFAPHIFYANSNIAPVQEYQRRRETLQDWAQSEGIAAFEGTYDPQAWEETAGRIGQAALEEAQNAPANDEANNRVISTGGGEAAGVKKSSPGPDIPAVLRVDPAKREARCRACYRLRLQEAARFAAEHGYEALGTTLTVSIYQYTNVIREELEAACAPFGLTPVFDDFRPYFDQAEQRSKELGMYRQNYCGCRFSEQEAAAQRAQRRAAAKAHKQAWREEHAEELAAEEQARQSKRAEKAAYAERQRQKHAALQAWRESQVRQ
ncbi:MAG: epoxyqueuosine reductase QueH [Coriobacteriia bacterium]|nr:epoxyqueuosine reductase QueH [Coriobacteriia bacterium]